MATNFNSGCKISEKHKRVVDEYMVNGNKKGPALLKCGYSATTANGNPASVFDRAEVIAEIEKRKAKLDVKYELTEEWIIQRMMHIANAGEVLAKFKKVNHKGELYWDFTGATAKDLAVISEMTTDTYMEGRGEDGRAVKKVSVKASDPKSALDSLMRHKGMFNDKVTHAGEVSLVERLQRGRERARSGTKE